MTMDTDEDLLHSTVYVLQDTLPEDTETFYVTLTNPTGGAEIGVENKITVNILSNDNAHGVIEVSPVSTFSKGYNKSLLRIVKSL